MQDQVLSIEQMQELIELGIDISNASMCWIGCANGNDVYPYNSTFKDIFSNHKETIPSVLIPTFTLQDIVNLLDKSHDLMVYYSSTMVWAEKNDSEKHIHEEYIEDSVLINAFNMLKWCKQNNYI